MVDNYGSDQIEVRLDEMTQEEKAKAYDRVSKEVKDFLRVGKKCIVTLFKL